MAIVHDARHFYRFCTCGPPEDVRHLTQEADFSIFYFLCTSQEIADFFSVNFRNIHHAFYLLSNSHYASARDLILFRTFYRLPAGAVFPVASNLAFQAAISNKQENHFFHMFNQRKLCNQDLAYFDQLQKIHFLVSDYMRGDLPWMMKDYF